MKLGRERFPAVLEGEEDVFDESCCVLLMLLEGDVDEGFDSSFGETFVETCKRKTKKITTKNNKQTLTLGSEGRLEIAGEEVVEFTPPFLPFPIERSVRPFGSDFEGVAMDFCFYKRKISNFSNNYLTACCSLFRMICFEWSF